MKSTVPVSILFVPMRILILDKEGTAGRNSSQVELGHVWHCEVDWTVMTEDKKRKNLESRDVNRDGND